MSSQKYWIAALVVLAFALLSVFQAPVPQESNNGGEVTIGGEFVLTDQHNKRFDSKSLQGKWRLMYFGFTHCPHICPTDVSHISNAMETLSSYNVVPVFITVDPERDTPEQLASYFSSFHKDFVALTGSLEEVKAVEKDYKIYSQKVDDEDGAEYTMNHSAYIYLMNQDGKYVTHFPHDTSGKDMAEAVLGYIYF